MDRILVLHKGELREQGTHQQLLAQRGIYRRLFELQFASGKEPAETARLIGGVGRRLGRRSRAGR